MARVSIPEEKKATTTGISLPPKLLARARRFAAAQNKSLSALVKELLLRETAK